MSGSLCESLAVVVEAHAGAAEVAAVEKGTEEEEEAEVEGGGSDVEKLLLGGEMKVSAWPRPR